MLDFLWLVYRFDSGYLQLLVRRQWSVPSDGIIRLKEFLYELWNVYEWETF